MEQHLYAEMASVERTHWWFVARRRIVARVIARVFAGRRDLKLLEVGCGTGGNLPLLQPYGTVTGIEPNPAAHPFLEQAAYPFVAAGLPGPLPFDPATFDAVVALDVLEHLADEAACLKVVVDLLKPGGFLIVTVPAHPFLWSGHDVVNHHYRRYPRAGLRSVLCGAGLQPVYLSYFNAILFPLIAGIRGLNRVLRRPERSDLAMPSPRLNALLQYVFAAERHVVGRFFSVPFGVSLVGVWQKPL
jgi:SAM-dependent methyltransferase